MCIEEFQLPVEDSVKFLNERLAQPLIKIYHNHSFFRTALVDFCKRNNRFNLLVQPINILEMIVINNVILEGLFQQVDIDCFLKHLETDAICRLLEMRQVSLVKKQVELVSAIGQTQGVAVLQKLGVCRVWMRLCLLLTDHDQSLCEQQLKRLLNLSPWSSEYMNTEGKE